MADKTDWLPARMAYLRGLKSPSEMQRLFLLLADKPNRTPVEEKNLNAVIRAEKAAEFAARARQEAANLVNAEKKAQAEVERKARTKRLIELGALFDLAGIGGQDRGALLGALLGMAKIEDADRWGQWKRAGDALLAEREHPAKTGTNIQPPATTIKGQRYDNREDSI
jgi:hypothetical protein